MDTRAPGQRWAIGSAVVLGLATLAWWTLRPAPAAPELPGPGVAAAAQTRPTPAARAPAAPTPERFATEDVPSRPSGSAEVDARGMVPHPITPQHQRIFRENGLIGELNGAMDVRDAPGLRRLLQQYRDEYPEDLHVLQDGYELIASCLENLTPQTRALAQRYYDEQLDSGVRRYIRRHCLEAPGR